MPKKFLIIRLSSIGDIIQCMNIINGIKNHYPNSKIHWFTRQDMASFLAMDKRIEKIWSFNRKDGLKGIIKAAKELKKEEYDFIYDAHSNIRSNILKFYLLPRFRKLFPRGPKYVLRSKERFKRILLFKFGINKFPQPFKGVQSYRTPLAKWAITNFYSNYNSWFFPDDYKAKFKNIIQNKKTITIVPSANWEMKRWPVSHWKKLIEIMPEYQFIILAGPTDTFCDHIENSNKSRIMNLAGKTSLFESCYIISKSNIVVSADTGFMHAADMFNVATIALIGPTAFGFPIGKTVTTMEVNMKCRPCTKDGKGKCKQNIWQKCMVDISPEMVAKEIQKARLKYRT